MWTLRDLFMFLSQDYKQKQIEMAARRMNDQPSGNNGYFINDRQGYSLEDQFRMHPQRELLTNQWDLDDKMQGPRHDQRSLYQYMNSQPPKQTGYL